MKYTYIIKSMFVSMSIFWMIGSGLVLHINGNIFWGRFNAMFGSLVVYFLCLNYFKEESKGGKK